MTTKTLIKDVLENSLFAVLHRGQFWDADGNTFGMKLGHSHDFCSSKSEAENQLAHLRKISGAFEENDGQVVRIEITLSGLMT